MSEQDTVSYAFEFAQLQRHLCVQRLCRSALVRQTSFLLQVCGGTLVRVLYIQLHKIMFAEPARRGTPILIIFTADAFIVQRGSQGLWAGMKL